MKKIALLLALIAAPSCAQIANLIDGSGTVTTGGTSQVVFQINTNRSYVECQNPITATETLFVNINAVASTAGGSYELAPAGSIRFSIASVPLGALSVTAATTGHRFICKQG